MKRAGLVIFAALAVLALGAGGWWWQTRLDRVLERVCPIAMFAEEEDLPLVLDHPGDPRAFEAAQCLAKDLAGNCSWTFVPPGIEGLHGFFAQQPLSDEEGAFIAATVLARCRDERAKAWGTFDGDTLARGVYRVLREGRHGGNGEALVGWLEEKRPPTSEPVMFTVALAVGTSTKAIEHVRAGFPQDGAPFVPAGEKVERIPPRSDPRLAKAIAEAVLQFNRITPSSSIIPALAEATRIAKVEPTDDVIRAVIRMTGSEKQLEVAGNILTADDLPRVRALGEDWSRGVVIAMTQHFGKLDAADIRSILDRVEKSVSSDYVPGGENEKQRQIAWSIRELVALGAPAIPVVTDGLKHDHHAVREVCVEALFELDRSRFVDEVFEAALAQKLIGGNIRRAITLAGEGSDPRLYLALLSFPSFAEEAAAALRSRLPADALVPALFAFLAIRSEFTQEEVRAYRALLRSSPDSAFATAAELDRALAQAGAPERVYWLTKLLALEHLSEVGTSRERPIVEKFVSDPSGYEDIRTWYNSRSGETQRRESTPRSFAAIAARALEAIDAQSR